MAAIVQIMTPAVAEQVRLSINQCNRLLYNIDCLVLFLVVVGLAFCFVFLELAAQARAGHGHEHHYDDEEDELDAADAKSILAYLVGRQKSLDDSMV